MVFPGGEHMNIYIADPYAVKELNLGNQWRAVWVEGGPLPADVAIIYGYAVVISEDKGYVTRLGGEERWGAVEGPVAGKETPAAFVKRAVLEQAGAAAGKAELVGYFDCKATSHNTDFPAGTRTVRPIYLFVATKMQDVGRGSAFERRRMPLNEFTKALRDHYPELQMTMTRAVDRYLVMQAKGEL
jgi:hypothetical protein